MELARFPSHGRFSVRSIFTFALTAFITAFLWVILASFPTHAADASWNGGSLEHDGRSYYLAGVAQSSNSLGIPADSKYYVSLETPTSTAPASLQKAHVIYLAPGADPPGDGTANYALYDYNASTKVFSNRQNAKAITVDTNSITAQATTCAIEGIGWIVCPMMNFLAWGMDAVFDIITGFMEVQPLQTGNTSGSLYNAWNIMRSIANIVFIIFFLIIIYSQITSVQINNYGLKRLLPRLIIAAVAINLSYIICAAAVDVSNVLGYSIHQMFLDLRNNLLSTGVTDTAAQANLWSWESVTGFVLSGGTAITAVGAAGVGTLMTAGGSITAALFLLLPALVGLLMAVLVVLLILAARQAIIVIFVIIAPLAIVSYLLPNTEKWFEKWRGVLVTMLVFFPAFSVVFGGSQLAGAIIIQNATSLNMLILGMIVQVAPLVITPLILKFGGGLLGNIARIVNNPNKGVIDRTRNWSKGHADWHANRGRNGLDFKGNPRRDKNGQIIMDKNGQEGLRGRNVLRRSARYLDQLDKRRADRTKNAELAGQTNYENSRTYSRKDRNGNLKYDMSEQKQYFEDNKTRTHSNHEAHVNKARKTQGSLLHDVGVSNLAAKERASDAENQLNRYYNTIRSNEKFANRVGASALFNSSYKVETSKAKLEGSESIKAAYYNTQKADATTTLGKTMFQVEGNKLRAETAQNTYTARVETAKGTAGTQMSIVAERAEASKEHLEYAQTQVQKFFDTQRTNMTSALGQSTVQLDGGKLAADQAKNNLTTYLVQERTTGSLRVQALDTENSKIRSDGAESAYKELINKEKATGSLRQQMLATNSAKRKEQNSELKLTRIVEEFNAGGERSIDAFGNEVITIDDQVVSNAERVIANEMFALTESIADETQGIENAKYQGRQRAFAELAKETAHAEARAKVAGSIDENGAQRARANAMAQRSRALKEVRENINAIFNYKNFTDAELLLTSQGIEVKNVPASHDAQVAAIQRLLSGKNAGEIGRALQTLDFSFPKAATEDEREELQIYAGEALESSPAKPLFITAGMIAQLKQGKDFTGKAFTKAYGERGLNKLIANAMDNQKVGSGGLYTAGNDYAQLILGALQDEDAFKTIGKDSRERLFTELSLVLNENREGYDNLKDSKDTYVSALDYVGLDAINNDTIDAKLLKTSGKAFAEGLLRTVQKNLKTIHPNHRDKLLKEVTSLLDSNSPQIADFAVTLEAIKSALND